MPGYIAACDRCTMSVEVDVTSATDGVCQTCMSWHCSSCRYFSLQRHDVCERCTTPRRRPKPPSIPQATPSGAAAPPSSRPPSSTTVTPTLPAAVVVAAPRPNVAAAPCPPPATVPTALAAGATSTPTTSTASGPASTLRPSMGATVSPTTPSGAPQHPLAASARPPAPTHVPATSATTAAELAARFHPHAPASNPVSPAPASGVHTTAAVVDFTMNGANFFSDASSATSTPVSGAALPLQPHGAPPARPPPPSAGGPPGTTAFQRVATASPAEMRAAVTTNATLPGPTVPAAAGGPAAAATTKKTGGAKGVLAATMRLPGRLASLLAGSSSDGSSGDDDDTAAAKGSRVRPLVKPPTIAGQLVSPSRGIPVGTVLPPATGNRSRTPDGPGGAGVGAMRTSMGGTASRNTAERPDGGYTANVSPSPGRTTSNTQLKGATSGGPTVQNHADPAAARGGRHERTCSLTNTGPPPSASPMQALLPPQIHTAHPRPGSATSPGATARSAPSGAAGAATMGREPSCSFYGGQSRGGMRSIAIEPDGVNATGDELRELYREIRAIRDTCRVAQTQFVCWSNANEMKKYEWASTTVIEAGVPALRPLLPAPRTALTVLPPGVSPSATAYVISKDTPWYILPPGGVRADQIGQGQLGDCWLLSALSVMAHQRPDLIECLFLVKELTPEGVFAVRLWSCGQWKAYIVDGNYPCVRKYATKTTAGRVSFRFGFCNDHRSLWVPILEKAMAKKYGAYENLSAGHCSEAFYDLTGLPCKVLRFEADAGTEEKDSLFASLFSYSTCACIMAASCGSTEKTKPVADRLKLRSEHAYSLLEVAVCRQSNRRLIRLRDPWSKTDYMGEVPPMSGSHTSRSVDPNSSLSPGTGALSAAAARAAIGPAGAAAAAATKRHDSGEFWMRYEEFITAFGVVTVCMTRQYKTRITALGPRCEPHWNFLPTSMSAGAVMFHVAEAAEVTAMVAQPQVRTASAGADHETNGVYFDVAVIVLRLPEVIDSSSSRADFSVVAMSESRCQRVVWTSAMLDPGVYVALPFTLQQHTLPIKTLSVTVLSETHAISELPIDDAEDQPLFDRIHANSNRWMFDWVTRQPPGTDCSISKGTWDTWVASFGSARFLAVRSNSTRDSTITVDTPHAKSVYYYGRKPKEPYVVTLPSMHSVVLSVSAALPHEYATPMNNALTWKMAELIVPRGQAPPVYPTVAQMPEDVLRTHPAWLQRMARVSPLRLHMQQPRGLANPAAAPIWNDRDAVADPLGVGFAEVPQVMRPFRQRRAR